MDIVDNFDVEGFDETDSPMRPKVASEAKANASAIGAESSSKKIKALANIRKKKKMSESQICELEAFEDWINESKDINDKITLLS